MTRSKRARNPKRGGVECGYCGATIPENALACPKCGKMFSATKKLIALVIVIVIVLAGTLSYIYFGDGQSAYLGDTDGTEQPPVSDDEQPPSSDDEQPPTSANLAPDFTYTAVNGGTVSLSGLQGNVVVLDFMATWCQPCKDQIVNLISIENEYSGRGVSVLSLNVDLQVSDRELLEYRNDLGATWDFMTDSDGVSMTGYSVTNIPTIVIINRDGEIAKRNVGVMSAAELRAVIDPLL